MHALVRLLEECHSINFIRYKLGNISKKLYRYQIDFAQLTSDEQELWLSFDIGDITFFLSGQRDRTPEYTKFLRISGNPNRVLQPQPVIAPHPAAVQPAPLVVVQPAPPVQPQPAYLR